MTVPSLAYLKHAQPPPCTDTAYAHRNVEPLPQSGTQFLRHAIGVDRQEIEVLRHAWLVHIRIHGLRAEDDHIVAPAQEFQDRLV
jgi:hypothetical protein